MPDQTSLFDIEHHDGHVSVRAPEEPDSSLSEDSRNDAIQRLRGDGTADTARAQLARLYYRAHHEGVRLSGETVHALTDKEAARVLTLSLSSINGRRNELMGGSGAPSAYRQRPIVEEHERRESLVDSSGQAVTAYRWTPGLFD